MTAIIGEEYCEATERELTVHKTSFFSPGDGFAVYDRRTGALAFRVDTYNRPTSNIIATSGATELSLLSPTGAAILTVRRKLPSLHHRWEGFLGDGCKSYHQKPLFTVRRSSIIGGSHCAVVVEVMGFDGLGGGVVEYRVEGSFSRRCCRVLAGIGDDQVEVEVVAEVRRKVDENMQVVMGRDVFSLWIKAGFDAAFVMGIVLVLDRICGDDDDEVVDLGDNGGGVHVGEVVFKQQEMVVESSV